MFDKLKNAFSSAAKSIGQKEITQRVLDDTLVDLQTALLESDVAQEVVDDLSNKLKKELLGLKLERGQESSAIIAAKLQESVASILARAGRLDLVAKIKAKKDAKRGPFSIVFLGINGTGKTTTVAKVANLLRKSGLSVVIAAGDTHRAGAIEQLTHHAQRLSLKVIAQRYGADPSAVGRDALDYAKKHYIDVVLIDTAGRMQTSKNLMDEMAKIVRVVKPDVKLFVGDSLAGNDTINQAREFFHYTNFDGAILTKIDADAKGGAAISISHLTAKPIVYVGIGQGYDDMIPFEPNKFIQSLFGSAAVSVQDLISIPPPPAPKTNQELKVAHEGSPAVSAPLIAPRAKEESKDKEEQKTTEPEYSPAPAPASMVISAPPPQPPASEPVRPEPEEKKSRFGFFGRRKDDGDESQGEDKKQEEKQRKEGEKRKKREDEERGKREEEERKRREMEEKKKRKDDKDKKEDEVVYLTDEDIEDLLK